MDHLACHQGLQAVQLAMGDLPMSSVESSVLYLSVEGTKSKREILCQRKYSHIRLDMGGNKARVRAGKWDHGLLSSHVELLIALKHRVIKNLPNEMTRIAKVA